MSDLLKLALEAGDAAALHHVGQLHLGGHVAGHLRVIARARGTPMGNVVAGLLGCEGSRAAWHMHEGHLHVFM